jgi:hypothetical protein
VLLVGLPERIASSNHPAGGSGSALSKATRASPDLWLPLGGREFELVDRVIPSRRADDSRNDDYGSVFGATG